MAGEQSEDSNRLDRELPEQLGVQAGRGVDNGRKEQRKYRANRGLGGELGCKVGRNGVAALSALALHENALLGEHVKRLDQR